MLAIIKNSKQISNAHAETDQTFHIAFRASKHIFGFSFEMNATQNERIVMLQ